MGVCLDGNSLTIEQVYNVAVNNERVELSQIARESVNHTRAYVEKKLNEEAVIYGLTTGFGKFSDTLISKEDTAQLQVNLIRSHACGMGEPLPYDVVRAAMLLRANALSKGFSGCRVVVIDTLIEMLNRGVCPVIPSQGSLGASGDLAPLSHIVLVMIGEGEAVYEGERMSGADAMKRAGVTPIRLEAKEGLALINGTQIMTAIGCMTYYGAVNLVKSADIAASLTCEALGAVTKAFDPKLHAVRPHKGQINTAANLLTLLDGSSLATPTKPDKVQDAYSLRCIPQVHGATRDALAYVKQVLDIEINAVTDNPIIFPDSDEVISGGNFHGQPVGFAMDFLGIAVAELADIAERRIERLVNPQLSGLPAFLTKNGGLNSGLMIAQYSAASIVSENKVLAHPATVDSIPSSANQEDHVSMGTTAARKALQILKNATKVIGIEMFAAQQALSFRDEKALGVGTTAALKHLRRFVEPFNVDIVMYPQLERTAEQVATGAVVKAVEEVGIEIIGV